MIFTVIKQRRVKVREDMKKFINLMLDSMPEIKEEIVEDLSKLTAEELYAKILINEETIEENRKIIKNKEKNNHYLKKDNQKYHDQINIISATKRSSEIAKDFISVHKGYKYIGKADGKTKFHEILISICVPCDKYLELFEYQTGIGEVLIGVCPKCKLEIDFTDRRKW